MKEKISKYLTIFIWIITGVLIVRCAVAFHSFKANPDPALYQDLQVYALVTAGVVVLACLIRGIVRRIR